MRQPRRKPALSGVKNSVIGELAFLYDLLNAVAPPYAWSSANVAALQRP
jgi:hypothetical protein